MHTSTRSILLLSDNKTLAQRLSSMLADGDPLYGPFELTISTHPQNKLWFRETLADLVLLDLDRLPQSDDFSWIPTDNGQTAVPIIALATRKTKFLGRQAVGDGAVDYLIVEELTPDLLCRLLHHAARPELRPLRRPSTSRLVADNSRLQETALRQIQKMAVMHDLAMAGIEATSEDALIERATQIIGETLYPTNFGVLLRDETNQSLSIHPAYKIDTKPLKFNHVPLDQGIVGIVATTGKPYRTGDVSNNPHYLEGDTRSRSELCVPIKVEGAILGVINVESTHFNAFSEADEQFLTTLANQVALALQKVRLLTRSQTRQAEAEMIREATIALTTSLDQDVVLSNLLSHLAKLIPYDTANVMLLESSNRMVVRASRGYTDLPGGKPVENDVIDLSEYPLLRELAETQKSVLISDTRQEPQWTTNPKSPYIRSWIGIPLITGGITIGCYSLDSASPGIFTQAHLELAQNLALQTAVAIQNIQLLQTTRRHAAELQIVSNLLQDLNAIPDVMEVFPKIAAVLKQIAQCNLVSLLLFDEDKRRARIMALDQPTSRYKLGTTFDLETAVFATNILNGRIYTKPNLQSATDNVERNLSNAGYRSMLGLPLISNEQIIGAFVLCWSEPHTYNNANFHLFTQISNGITLALERSRLFGAIKQWAQQLTILHELGRQITRVLDTTQLCQLAVEHLSHSLNYDNVSVFTSRPDKEEVILQGIAGAGAEHYVIGEHRVAFGRGLIGRCAQSGEILIVNDTQAHPDFVPSSFLEICSEAVFPLRVGQQTIGVISVNSNQPNAFDENDETTLTIAADQLAVALEKARLFEETQQRTAELEAIVALSSDLRTAQTTAEMMPIILKKAIEIVGGNLGLLYLIEVETEDLHCASVFPHQPQLLNQHTSIGQGIAGRVVTSGEMFITNDIEQSAHSFSLPVEPEFSPQIRSNISLPLRDQERIVGVLSVCLPDVHQFSAVEIRLLTAVSEIAGSALDRAIVLETLEQRVQARTHELAQANARLHELDKLKSKFVADVSHELRTPITNLGIYLGLFSQGNLDKQAKYLSVLQKQTERLRALSEDILNLSRIELGKDKIKFSNVPLNDVVEPVITAHLPTVEETGLTLEVDLAPDLPDVYGERNQLAQIVTNLLDNAIHYTQQGTIQIQTEWDPARQQVGLTVTDTGIGIDPDDMDHLFDRFYRGHYASQSNIPGTGLGLAIVKEIVDLHEGDIVIMSALGQGSTFQVWLPVSTAS